MASRASRSVAFGTGCKARLKNAAISISTISDFCKNSLSIFTSRCGIPASSSGRFSCRRDSRKYPQEYGQLMVTSRSVAQHCVQMSSPRAVQ
jgi:hypothetical protein